MKRQRGGHDDSDLLFPSGSRDSALPRFRPSARSGDAESARCSWGKSFHIVAPIALILGVGCLYALFPDIRQAGGTKRNPAKVEPPPAHAAKAAAGRQEHEGELPELSAIDDDGPVDFNDNDLDQGIPADEEDTADNAGGLPEEEPAEEEPEGVPEEAQEDAPAAAEEEEEEEADQEGEKPEDVAPLVAATEEIDDEAEGGEGAADPAKAEAGEEEEVPPEAAAPVAATQEDAEADAREAEKERQAEAAEEEAEEAAEEAAAEKKDPWKEEFMTGPHSSHHSGSAAAEESANDMCFQLQAADMRPTYFPDPDHEVVNNPRWDDLDGGYVKREYAPEPPSKYESTFYCKDTAAFNQSCIVRNAYLVPGEMGITLHIVGNKFVPKMRMTTYGGEKFGDGKRPTVKRWKSAQELEEYIATQRVFSFEPLTLNVKIRYQFNWAHAFFDGLYPAFIALAKFGRYREPFYTFLDAHEWDASGATNHKDVRGFYSRQDPCFGNEHMSMICKVREVVRLFGSLGDPQGEYLTWQVARRCRGRLFRFKEMVLGAGAHGQRQATIQLSQSLSMKYLNQGKGLLPIFRERLMMAFGLAPPRRASSNQGRDPMRPLQAYIADNERFGGLFEFARNRLKEFEAWYNSNCRRTKVTLIKWGNYNTFGKQLRMILDTDIWITSVGSAQYYGVLLNDGSVLLQLGYADPDLKKLPHYGEEFILASNPRIRVVHAPLPQVRRFPSVPELADNLEKAVALIRSDFKVPVENPHEHLSVYARLVMEATRRDPFFKEILTGINFDVKNPKNGARLTPKHTGNCPRKYPAEVIFETVKMKNNCFLKNEVLRPLKLEFNLTTLLEVTPTGDCVVCLEFPGTLHQSVPTITNMPSSC